MTTEKQIEANRENANFQNSQKAEKSVIKRGERGKFLKGHAPKSPGAPKLTAEQKMIRRTVRELIEEYEESLAESLPQLSSVLKKKASEGDIGAIKEIHDVIGAGKSKTAPPIVPIQINFQEEREKYG